MRDQACDGTPARFQPRFHIPIDAASQCLSPFLTSTRASNPLPPPCSLQCILYRFSKHPCSPPPVTAHLPPTYRPQVLWLSDNYLTRISGLEQLLQLRELHLARNDIAFLGDGLAACTALANLNLADNKIGSFKVWAQGGGGRGPGAGGVSRERLPARTACACTRVCVCMRVYVYVFALNSL